jgi:hypothetical protein
MRSGPIFSAMVAMPSSKPASRLGFRGKNPSGNCHPAGIDGSMKLAAAPVGHCFPRARYFPMQNSLAQTYPKHSCATGTA